MLVVSSSVMGHPSVIQEGLYAKLNSKCVLEMCNLKLPSQNWRFYERKTMAATGKG